MSFRPLLLLSIVLTAVTAVAQTLPLGARPSPIIDDTVSPSEFHRMITGTVRDMGGHPLSGVRVETRDCLIGRTISITYTSIDGKFALGDLPQGQYEIVASAGVNEARDRVEVPGSGEVTLRLATDASLADRTAGSNSVVSLSQMQVPGKARKLYQKAMNAFRKSHFDDAYSFVQKALGVYPDYAQALTLRGVMNLQRGDIATAEPDLQKAVELDYSDDTGFVALASLYNTEGKFDNALQVLDHGMSMHPNSWQALSEMARAQIGKHLYEAALKSITEADNYVPPAVAYLHLFRAQALLGMNNVPAAVTELQTYLAREPTGQNADIARKVLAKLGASEITQAKK
jgi:tetratricopeptide (TPR) repeat protein